MEAAERNHPGTLRPFFHRHGFTGLSANPIQHLIEFAGCFATAQFGGKQLGQRLGFQQSSSPLAFASFTSILYYGKKWYFLRMTILLMFVSVLMVACNHA